MRENLEAMTAAAQAAGARVLLAGMRLQPNYGPYASDFAASFKEVARTRRAALLDFLLAPVAAERDYFQADNLHPTAAAQPLILDHIWPALLPLLR
jgi:acyl-CoA thioesterase-1